MKIGKFEITKKIKIVAIVALAAILLIAAILGIGAIVGTGTNAVAWKNTTKTHPQQWKTAVCPNILNTAIR